jgi:proline iminopeptidase
MRFRRTAGAAAALACLACSMMASIPAYNEYAKKVLMPAMDQRALAEILKIEAAGRFEDPRYMELLIPNYYEKHILRMPAAEWPDPLNRAFARMNGDIYVPMQGPSEMGVFDIISICAGSIVSYLAPITSAGTVICSRSAVRSQFNSFPLALKRGRYLLCPNGSHRAMYDDQKVYMDGVAKFVHEVDAGRF